MNAAQRIVRLLSEIEKSSNQSALQVFEEVFGVNGCFEVAYKLRFCLMEIEKIEKVAADADYARAVIVDLKNIFQCRDLSAAVNKAKIPQLLRELGGYVALMPNDDGIDEERRKTITDLADRAAVLRKRVEDADIEDGHKEVLTAFLNEIIDGLDGAQWCGVDYLRARMLEASGRLVLYQDVFTDSEMFDDFKALWEKTVELLGDITTYYAAVQAFMDVVKAIAR